MVRREAVISRCYVACVMYVLYEFKTVYEFLTIQLIVLPQGSYILNMVRKLVYQCGNFKFSILTFVLLADQPPNLEINPLPSSNRAATSIWYYKYHRSLKKTFTTELFCIYTQKTPPNIFQK